MIYHYFPLQISVRGAFVEVEVEKTELDGKLGDKASAKIPQSSSSECELASHFSFASCEELGSTTASSHSDVKGTAFHSTEIGMIGDGDNGDNDDCHSDPAFSIPKLPLNLVRGSTNGHSERSDLRWPGTVVQVPPWPAPPEAHPLITPRTGALAQKQVPGPSGPFSKLGSFGHQEYPEMLHGEAW